MQSVSLSKITLALALAALFTPACDKQNDAAGKTEPAAAVPGKAAEGKSEAKAAKPAEAEPEPAKPIEWAELDLTEAAKRKGVPIAKTLAVKAPKGAEVADSPFGLQVKAEGFEMIVSFATPKVADEKAEIAKGEGMIKDAKIVVDEANVLLYEGSAFGKQGFVVQVDVDNLQCKTAPGKPVPRAQADAVLEACKSLKPG